MAIYHTDFTEYPTGVTPAGWTPIWTTTDYTHTVESGMSDQVVEQSSMVNGYPKGIIYDALGTDVYNVDVRVRFQITDSWSGNNSAGLIIRGKGEVGVGSGCSGYVVELLESSNFLYVGYVYYNGNLNRRYSKYISTILNTVYWLRVVALNNYIYVKLWADGNPEGLAWDIIYRADFGTITGGIGLYTSMGTAQFDELTVDTAPAVFGLTADPWGTLADAVNTNRLTIGLLDSLNTWGDRTDGSIAQARFTDALYGTYGVFQDSILVNAFSPSRNVTTPPIIAFSAGGETNEGSKHTYTVEGVLAPDLSIDWIGRIYTPNGSISVGHPVRIVHDGSSSAICVYNSSTHPHYGQPYMVNYYNGANADALIENVYYADEPEGEEFDLHTTGLAIVYISYLHTTAFTDSYIGDRLSISTDFGATWGDPIKIDYLDNLLGADYDSCVRARTAGYSLCVDESTGIFYLLTIYFTPDSDYENFVLLTSSDGITWTHIKTWVHNWVESPLYDSTTTMSVSNGHIYIILRDGDDTGFYCNYSANSGATWVENYTPYTDLRYWGSVAANEATAIYVFPFYVDPPGETHLLGYRTTDGGATWTKVIDIRDAADDMYATYLFVRSSQDIFAITTCNAAYPNASNTWTDIGGVHTMEDESYAESFLCFWYSADDGVTWILGVSPLPQDGDSVAYWQQSLDIFALPPLPTHALVYVRDLMEGRRGWFYDSYDLGIRLHYGEEGAAVHSILCGSDSGGVYLFTGTSDAGSAIKCQVTTKHLDMNDPRHNKLFGDVMLDCNTNSVAVTATPQFNNASTSSPAVTVTNATRAQVPVPVGSDWVVARNISLDIQWNTNGATPLLYIWEPRFTEVGTNVYAYSWSTSYLTHGFPGYFYHGYLYLRHVSTADLTFTITDEDGTLLTATTIAHTGGLDRKDFIRLPVCKTKLAKYTLTSTTQFKVDGEESELLVKPWGRGAEWTHMKIFKDVAMGEAQ